MTYAVYTTEALVCGSFLSNTADKQFLLFTRDAGMVYASARSVREERSRQRYALQEFSLVQVSLIKGKSGWRIGSVEAKENPFLRTTSRAVRASLLMVVRLLRRFVQGEEPHPALYREMYEQLQVLGQPDLEHRRYAEAVARLRTLYQLGYIAADEALSALLTPTYAEALSYPPSRFAAEVESVLIQVDQVSHL